MDQCAKHRRCTPDLYTICTVYTAVLYRVHGVDVGRIYVQAAAALYVDLGTPPHSCFVTVLTGCKVIHDLEYRIQNTEHKIRITKYRIWC